jgi:hypothetical protein
MRSIGTDEAHGDEYKDMPRRYLSTYGGIVARML